MPFHCLPWDKSALLWKSVRQAISLLVVLQNQPACSCWLGEWDFGKMLNVFEVFFWLNIVNRQNYSVLKVICGFLFFFLFYFLFSLNPLKA